MNEIKAENLTMQFGDVTALQNINLTFKENKIYGLLGRNGAGKSTLLNLISNRLFPTGGHVTIDGLSASENDRAQSKLYCMSDKLLYVDTAKISTIFRWTKLFYPDFDADYCNKLCEKFGLNTSKKVKALSTGYLSIFKLIIALSVNAPYLLLDEPVLGLDANHRELFYKILLKNYSEHPKTIIISTHLIEEVADLVEQVVIIKAGQILLNKPTEEVLQMGYSISGKAASVENYLNGKEILSVESLGGLKTACILGIPENVPANLEISKLDLQKLFVQLTNV